LRGTGTPSGWGGLLVLSAGLAREYDGEDLGHEPWHLGLPFAASVVSCALLVALVRLHVTRTACAGCTLARLYAAFLGLYWMTAPLAWLYAIPIERFAAPGVATSVNLFLLALVATWRVLLFGRVISVLFQTGYVASLAVVLLFADAVMLAALRFVPLPVFSIMGGVRLSESERLIREVANLVIVLGVLSMPVWLIVCGIVGFRWRKRAMLALPAEPRDAHVGRGLVALAAASVAVWAPILLLTQPEQQLRRRVERALRDGNLEQGLSLLAAHPRDAFPPHWDPPPRIGYGEARPSVFDVLQAAQRIQAPHWILALYLPKLDYAGPMSVIVPSFPWKELVTGSDERVEAVLAALESIPEGPGLLAKQKVLLQRLANDEKRSSALRARVSALLPAPRSNAEGPDPASESGE